MNVADRYLQNNERVVKNCPSCKAEDVDYLIHNDDAIECPKCYVEPETPGLGELTDKYMREGISEDDSFQQACEDKGVELPKRKWRHDY